MLPTCKQVGPSQGFIDTSTTSSVSYKSVSAAQHGLLAITSAHLLVQSCYRSSVKQWHARRLRGTCEARILIFCGACAASWHSTPAAAEHV